MANEGSWQWFVALDGGDLDGLIGKAGLLRFDWPERRIVYSYYEGVSAGHAVSISPSGKYLLLGNFSQQILVVDPRTLQEIKRQSTMAIEEVDYRLRANTHHLWHDDETFIGAVGEYLYEFRLDDLAHPRRLGAHRLWNAHELRWDKDHRYIVMGDVGPEDSGARQVGIYDLATNDPTIIRLPGTVWHTAVHPDKPLGYAATYSFAIEDSDYVDWAPAYTREYVFEFDLERKEIRRSWSSDATFPIHLNSDLEVWGGDREALYVASGGSHRVVEIELEHFRDTRHRLVIPPWYQRILPRQWWNNFRGALLRKSPFDGLHLILQTYRVTDNRTFDGVYCVRVSPDGRYLIAGNRGYNSLEVMDRQTLETVYRRQLPFEDGLHLGLHHSEMLAR